MKQCLQLFVVFFNIGAFTIGGGYAMLDMVEKAIVGKHKWIDKDDFWDMITVVQSLPGVFAVNTALYTGYRIKGLKGAAAACLGSIIPSITIILLIAIFFKDYKDNSVVESIFKGIRPCVVALILSPAIKMAVSAKLTLGTAMLPIAAVLLVCLCKVSPTYVILTTIVLSIGMAFYSKHKIENKKP